jgi:hypothetical protein
MSNNNVALFLCILLLSIVSISYCRKTEYESISHSISSKYKNSHLMLSVFSNFAKRDESVLYWLEHTSEECKKVNVYRVLIKQKKKVDRNFYYASDSRLKFIIIEFLNNVYNAFLECKVIPKELNKAIIQFDEVVDLLYRNETDSSEKFDKKCKKFFYLRNLKKIFLNIDDLYKQKSLSRKDRVKRIVVISMILMRTLNNFNKVCWSQKK